jgi:hypothetical protein
MYGNFKKPLMSLANKKMLWAKLFNSITANEQVMATATQAK